MNLKPLKQALITLKSIVPTKSINQAFTFIKASKSSITGTDGVTAMKIELPFEFEEEFLMDASLVNFLTNVSGEEVDFTFNEKTIKVSTKKSKLEITKVDVSIFPKIDFNEETGNHITMSKDDINQVIDKIIPSTGTDNKAIFEGVNFSIDSDSNLIISATNSYEAAIIQPAQFGDEILNITIPKQLFKMVSSNIEEDIIKLSLSKNSVIVQGKKVMIKSKLIDGTYPEIIKLIPTEFNYSTSLSKESFIEAITLIEKVGGEIAKLEFKNMETEITNSIKKIRAVGSHSNPTPWTESISFKTKMLLSHFKRSSKNIEINFASPTKPATIVEDNLTLVLLPVRTQ